MRAVKSVAHAVSKTFGSAATLQVFFDHSIKKIPVIVPKAVNRLK